MMCWKIYSNLEKIKDLKDVSLIHLPIHNNNSRKSKMRASGKKKKIIIIIIIIITDFMIKDFLMMELNANVIQ